MMRIAMTGSTGLIGSALTRHLRGRGHEVTRIVRSFSGLPHGERAVIWHPDRGVIEAAGLEGHDVAINLAGENIAGVWTAAKKRRIRESRVQGTSLLATTLAALERPPRTLVSVSGMNIYRNRPFAHRVDESGELGDGFLAEVSRAWEAAAQPATDAGIRVVHPRMANVLSPDGGMLGAFLPIFRLGLGSTFGDGRQPWPWIALDDVAPALLHVLERPEIAGPVNFAAPGAVTNAEFTETLAAVVGRPTFLKVPGFAAKLAPGGMSQNLLLGGARMEPRRLLDSGYAFRYPDLKPALMAMLQ